MKLFIPALWLMIVASGAAAIDQSVSSIRPGHDLAKEYLAPNVENPSREYLSPVDVSAAASETKFTNDGYEYKTVRSLKYRKHRHRRDVSELPIITTTQEYLPPIQIEDKEEEEEEKNETIPKEKSAVLADDGYHYRTVRRLKFRSRHRRDVDENVPTIAPPTLSPAIAEKSVADQTAVLTDDGYRYKSVRKFRYRH